MAKLVLSTDGVIVHQCFLDQERVSIGRDASNHVVIDDPAVSAEHAAIFQVGNDHVLSDLNSAQGTIVNGARLDRYILQHGDVVEFGAFNLRYLNPRASTESAMDRTMLITGLRDVADMRDEVPTAATNLQVPTARTARTRYPDGRVHVQGGARSGKLIELDRVVAMFGKPGEQIAVVTRRPHGFFVTHVEGRHFPRVNGQSIGSEPRLLRSGDVIEIADEQLTLTQD
ncbi:MAG: FHA domain-containing protein [Betaproteobacteria bacterium]